MNLQPVSLTSFFKIFFKASLDLLFELGCFAGADEESQKTQEEAVVGQSEDEANDESRESSTGAETLPGVSPADDDDRDDCGRHPAERGDGETEIFLVRNVVNIFLTNLPAVQPENKRFLMINRKSEQIINKSDPRVRTPLAACLVTRSNSGLDIISYFQNI